MKSIKKYLIPFAVVAFMACNSGEEKVETKTTTEESTTTPPSTTKPSTTTTTPKEEPKKTSVSVGPDGASVETKKGNQVSVSKDSVKLGTKDVKISVGTKKKN